MLPFHNMEASHMKQPNSKWMPLFSAVVVAMFAIQPGQAELLEKFPSLPPGRYEQIERLEQLRVLENGYDIMVGLTEDPTLGVDTPADVKKFEKWLG